MASKVPAHTYIFGGNRTWVCAMPQIGTHHLGTSTSRLLSSSFSFVLNWQCHSPIPQCKLFTRRGRTASGNVDIACAFWTSVAEESLLALAQPLLQPDDLCPASPLPAAPEGMKRGRGTSHLIRQVRLFPKQPKVSGAPKTCALARLHAAYGALRPVLAWHRGRGAEPGQVAREVQVLVRRVCELRPSYTLPPVSGRGEEEAHALMGRLLGLAKAQAASEDRERVRAWLAETWPAKPGAVYRWLGGDDFAPPVIFIARADRTATADLREMDTLVRDALAPINQKYAAALQPCSEEFLGAFGRHGRRVPMLAQPITGERPARQARKMRPAGPSRSCTHLPACLMEWPAALLELVETTVAGDGL